jgi:Arc/MetJ-type ribon-helix-helix transcriptional regulator
MPNKPADMVTLKIPRPLYERLRHLIEGTGFRSVTEFATYVLRDLASQPSSGEKALQSTANGGSKMNEKELKTIIARLRDLGYL